MDFFRVDAKRVAQFIAGESVETGVVGVQFGAELGAADIVPAEGFAVVHQLVRIDNTFLVIHIVTVEVGYLKC